MYETTQAHPQRVGGWGLFQLDDGATVVARDPRRVVIRAQPRAGLTPDAIRTLFDLLDGSRSVDGVVDAIQDRHPEVSPTAVRHLVRRLAEQRVLVDARAPVPDGLTLDDLASYRRHLAYYADFETPQRSRFDIHLAVKRSRVLLVGLGGAGSLMAASLVSSGVRRLIGVDGDAVEATNLHRQLFYTADDIDKPKAVALRERLQERAPDLEFTAVPRYLMSGGELEDLLDDVDLVIHVADYPPRGSRIETTRACQRRKVPLLLFFNAIAGPLCIPGETACYRCYERASARAHSAYRNVPEQVDAHSPYTSRTMPGLNMLMCGLATWEAVSFLAGTETPATINGMVAVDAPSGQARRVPLERDPGCDVCGG
ncbi:TOMM precursor leader peptide-binding protein [Actinomadura sp. ATCC 31491]|uniref:TOMM leader peptide-binding protein n=1 Tax=Actinomadura luzonensis TaxID=2805427 RepID=A0ABT0FSR7_9ACTN|nr:TOMM precursor leader peptide-binding protein [Actinomadura luzonensis]MCK2215375.1 TOMM precursor leader peptide-binding protein [Actinomadura luzonensis]